MTDPTPKRRRIGVVTTSRADYSHLYWPLRELSAHPQVDLAVFALGAHLSPDFGNTIQEIERDGFPIQARIECLLSSDSDTGMAKTIGVAILGVADALTAWRPDLLLTAAAHCDLSALLAPVLLAPVLHTTHFVADLARFMIHALAPDREISIEFTQPRPGDKEAEQFWSENDVTHPATPDAGSPALISIQSATLASGLTGGQFTTELTRLCDAAEARDLAAALAHLRAFVPEYTPSPSVLALAQQAFPQVPQ